MMMKRKKKRSNTIYQGFFETKRITSITGLLPQTFFEIALEVESYL